MLQVLWDNITQPVTKTTKDLWSQSVLKRLRHNSNLRPEIWCISNKSGRRCEQVPYQHPHHLWAPRQDMHRTEVKVLLVITPTKMNGISGTAKAVFRVLIMDDNSKACNIIQRRHFSWHMFLFFHSQGREESQRTCQVNQVLNCRA